MRGLGARHISEPRAKSGPAKLGSAHLDPAVGSEPAESLGIVKRRARDGVQQDDGVGHGPLCTPLGSANSFNDL